MAVAQTTSQAASQGAVASEGTEEQEVAGVAFLRRQWDRVAAWGCVVVGAMALLIGWMGISDTPFAAEQIPFVISGGIGGVFFLGVGAMLWISADLHDEWRKLDEIETVLREQLEDGVVPSARTSDRHVLADDTDPGEGPRAAASTGNGRAPAANRSRRPLRASGD